MSSHFPLAQTHPVHLSMMAPSSPLFHQTQSQDACLSPHLPATPAGSQLPAPNLPCPESLQPSLPGVTDPPSTAWISFPPPRSPRSATPPRPLSSVTPHATISSPEWCHPTPTRPRPWWTSCGHWDGTMCPHWPPRATTARAGLRPLYRSHVRLVSWGRRVGGTKKPTEGVSQGLSNEAEPWGHWVHCGSLDEVLCG